MPWWDIVRQNVTIGDILMTPGRGMQGRRQKQFSVVSLDQSKIIIHSGSYDIPLDRQCFDAIEQAFHLNPNIKLRVASLHNNEAFPDSADAVIREATRSNLARGNYVCSVLARCNLVRYVMQGERKCISLP